MQSKFYKGYNVWGHAIPQDNGYAASGTITRKSKVIAASGVLVHLMTEEEAQTVGMDWALAWVDGNS